MEETRSVQTAHYWRGRGKDFHLAKIEVPEAKRHATIKTLFPFVTFGVFEKPSFGDHATMNPVAVMVKLFVDGWAAFLDDKTMFDPRILLAIGNQAYIDGDFVINGVDYTENRKKSGSHQTRCWREQDSNLRFPDRSAFVFETAVRPPMTVWRVSRPGTASSNPSPSSEESSANPVGTCDHCCRGDSRLGDRVADIDATLSSFWRPERK
jgi:hypothetical protein